MRYRTFGEATYSELSVPPSIVRCVCGSYLGRDERGQRALRDVAHLVGWPSISINWVGSAVRFGSGDAPGLARWESGDGGRAEAMERLSVRDLEAPSS